MSWIKLHFKNHYFSSKSIFLFLFDIYVELYCSSWGKIIYFCFFSVLPPPSLIQSNFVHCRINDIFNFPESRIKTSHEINEMFKIEIPYLTYFRIYAGIKLHLKNNTPPQSPPKIASLSYLYTKNPQCKYLSSIFYTNNTNATDLSKLTSYKYFNNICPEPYNPKQTSMFINQWNLRFIPNFIRNFMLLRNNNKLLLNLRIYRFLEKKRTTCPK